MLTKSLTTISIATKNILYSYINMAAVPKNNIYIVFSGKVIFYNIIFKSVG